MTTGRTTHSAPRGERWHRPLRAHVTRVTRPSPSMACITVGGDDLAGFTTAGPDEWLRLFLPQPGQARPELPISGGADTTWWDEVCAMPEAVRPIVRNYTVRRHHPRTSELDIEFVLHGEGPASTWAERAAPGDEVGLLLQGAPYDPDATAPWRLLAGDETALPAMSAILESLPAGARARAFVLIPSVDEARDLDGGGDVEVRWVCRDAVDGDGHAALVEAVREAAVPDGSPYAWLAGEAGLVRDLRRHLVDERGVDRDAICFLGYWRRRTTADRG